LKYFFGIVLLIISACSGAPSGHNTMDHALHEGELYVVFDGNRTHLIAPSEKGYVVSSSFDGALIGAGPALWMYNLAESMEPQADCSCVMEAMMSDDDDSQCSANVAKERAVLTRVRDSELVYPFEIRSTEESESSYSFQISGQWGDLLLLESCADQYSCGAAHPWYHCVSTTLDLKTGELSEIASWVGDVDLKPALDEIRTHDPEFEGQELEVSTARVILQDRNATVQVLMSGPTCYACSDGNWSAYTNSGWSLSVLTMSLPEPVASFFKENSASPVVFFKVDETNRAAISPFFANELPAP